MKKSVELELKSILARPQGREFLAWLIFDVCGVLRSSFAHNALITAEREGERNVGLRLHAEMERISPTDVSQMYKEFANVRKSRNDSA